LLNFFFSFFFFFKVKTNIKKRAVVAPPPVNDTPDVPPVLIEDPAPVVEPTAVVAVPPVQDDAPFVEPAVNGVIPPVVVGGPAQVVEPPTVVGPSIPVIQAQMRVDRVSLGSNGGSAVAPIVRGYVPLPRVPPPRANREGTPPQFIDSDEEGRDALRRQVRHDLRVVRECVGTNKNTGEQCSRDASIDQFCPRHYNELVIKMAPTADQKRRATRKRDKHYRQMKRERINEMNAIEAERLIANGVRREDIEMQESVSDSGEDFQDRPKRLRLPSRHD
jgi:hypothetical protein